MTIKPNQCTFKKIGGKKNTYKNQGLYAKIRQTKQFSVIARTFPQTEWREPRSILCSGNETVQDPKSQPTPPTPKRKRSAAALAARKANRKAKRAEHRKFHRRLRKCHDREATYHDTYTVAQECPDHNHSQTAPSDIPLPTPREETTPPKVPFKDIKLASLNLDGGINHISGRQKIVHLMKQQHLDFLALQETRVNTDSTETHQGHTFYFSTSVTHEMRSEADKTRQTQNALQTKTLSALELYNLDAEKHGVGLVYSERMRHLKHDVQQLSGRLLVATFLTCPVRTNIVIAYAPHAGRSIKDKDLFYKDLQTAVSRLPKHEINIIMGDFNARLMERFPHEHDFIGSHIFRENDSTTDQLSEKQKDNRTRFVSFCQEHGFVISNTWFPKEPSKLVTYRNVAAPHFQGPFTTDRYAQLDYILINQRWKNSIHNVETSNSHAISTDHKLVIAEATVKLAVRTKGQECRSLRFRKPTEEQIRHYNELVSQKVQTQDFQDNPDPFAAWAHILIDSALACFPTIPPQQRKPYISDIAWQLLCEKQRQNEQGLQEAKATEATLRKQIRKDKRRWIQSQLEEMNEHGYKWSGIKRLKKKFVPKYTKFRDTHGEHVSEAMFPEKAAEYLATVQWKQPETPCNPNSQPLSNIGQTIKDTEFEPEEFDTAISSTKNKKTPGPDRVQAELVKYLDSCNRGILLRSYNNILLHNKYYDSLNLANIASIFKKGDPSKFANYRPIALLQTFYKLLASMLKQRLAAGLEPWLHKTQYGFRSNKSTSQALFLARRLMDLAERQGTNMTLILLDWEKAFDKIDQNMLLQVLQRLALPQNIIAVVQNIYKEAKFRVVRGEQNSTFRTQDSGIRQGCPLSPYLFGIVMTAIFQDIRSSLNTPKQKEPIQGIHFAEVLYADDTLLFGTHTHTINKLLHEVQHESGKYNMKLNMDKCVNLTINRRQSTIKFMDGTVVPRKSQALYLGATLTDSVDNHKEITQRLGAVKATALQLQPFWSKSYTSVKWRLQVLEAALNTKLLYGLETIQLTKSEQNLIDNFQTKMLRRVLRVPSTYIDREWTNQRVINTLTHQYGYHFVKLSHRWKSNKIRLLGHILRSSSQDPMREVLFETGTYIPRIEHTKRVGKPRAHWLLETCHDAYEVTNPDTVFDISNQQHILNLAALANRREPPFNTRRNARFGQ